MKECILALVVEMANDSGLVDDEDTDDDDIVLVGFGKDDRLLPAVAIVIAIIPAKRNGATVAT
jgi:hypothetical protein